MTTPTTGLARRSGANLPFYPPSVEELVITEPDEAMKYHAIEGGQQTLSRLAAYVTEIVRKGVED